MLVSRRVVSPLLPLLLLAPALAQDEPPPKPEPEAAAVALAERYVGLIKEKKVAQALKELWSFEKLCEGIFKGDWRRMKEPDREACARAMHDVLLPSMNDPRVAEAMARATYEDFQAKKPSGSKLEVTFVVTLPLEGAEPTTQHMWVQKVGEEWRIVDMANGKPEARITRSVGAQWEQVKKENKGITPLEYVRLMAQSR